MRIECHSYDLKLRDPFTISRGTVTVQPTLIVQVEYNGLIGLGEATTNAYYGVTLESMSQALDRIRPYVASYRLDNPAELWKQLDPQIGDCRFAQCAFDCAVWDIYAQMHNQALWQLWGLHGEDAYPPSCYTIGLDTPQEMVRKMQAMPDWPVYKIKLNVDGGMELVRALRAKTKSTFRVDANCSWQAANVRSWADELSVLNVELIEQPLPAEAYGSMRALKGNCAIPLMADESCQVEADVDRCIDTFDAINIKLVKCGGLTPARRMIARAKQNGLKVMVGCMTESSIGIAAGVHLLPLLDYADLDGALLLAEDIATGLQWEQGYCRLPTSPGLGVTLRQS
jgi:L-Ala-D/L-Glu epimerase